MGDKNSQEKLCQKVVRIFVMPIYMYECMSLCCSHIVKPTSTSDAIPSNRTLLHRRCTKPVYNDINLSGLKYKGAVAQ